MENILVLFIGFLIAFSGKIIFKKIYNPLTIYFTIFPVMIVLYNIRMLKFFILSWETWIVLIVGCFSLYFGVLIAAHMTEYEKKLPQKLPIPKLFADEGKTIKKIIYFCSFIGLFGAIQNWYVLLKKFGSIAAVLVQGQLVYRMRVEGMFDIIPYLQVLTFIGITFAGLYTAYKNKFTFLALLPMAASILKSIASFGRIGMLLAIVHFVSSYLIAKYYFKQNGIVTKVSRNIIISVIILIMLVLGSAGVVKSFRGTFEKYKGASKELTQLSGNPFFSPSIYLYLSSHVGVLDAALFYDTEKDQTRIGQNTFAAVYNLLSKFNITEPVPFDLPGYFIPVWTNTGSYLRDLYVDFGPLGISIGPFIIGFIITFSWFRFFQTGSMRMYCLVNYFFMIVVFSFFALLSRSGDWTLSLVILLFGIPYLENYIYNKSLTDAAE